MVARPLQGQHPDLRAQLSRKLDDILQELTPLERRGKVTRFLNSAQDVEKLNGLVEDIRAAMMDYQVRP